MFGLVLKFFLSQAAPSPSWLVFNKKMSLSSKQESTPNTELFLPLSEHVYLGLYKIIMGRNSMLILVREIEASRNDHCTITWYRHMLVNWGQTIANRMCSF